MKTEEMKKKVDDMVNRLKRETTDRERAELAGDAAPSGGGQFFDWHAWIDGLKFAGPDCPWLEGEAAAKLREALHGIARVTREVGGRFVSVGKRVLRWLYNLIRRYPDTAIAAVIMAGLSYLVSNIPILGWLLGSLVQLVSIVVVGVVFVKETSSMNLANA